MCWTLLDAREKLVTSKLWEQEAARIIEEESKKKKTEERLEKALELQKLLDEAALKKKNPVQQHPDAQPGSSCVQVSPIKVLTKVINFDLVSPPCFYSLKVLTSFVSERSFISPVNIRSQANVQLGLEIVNVAKPAIPMSALKFDSTSSIEVLDEESLMIPRKDKDLEILVTQTIEIVGQVGHLGEPPPRVHNSAN